MAQNGAGAMLGKLWMEASRRRVFRGAALYIIVAWGIVQAVGLAVPPGDPIARLAATWAMGLFPLAVLFSWVFQVRPGAVERESHDAAAPPVTPLGRAFDIAAFAGVGVIVVFEAARFVLRSS